MDAHNAITVCWTYSAWNTEAGVNFYRLLTIESHPWHQGKGSWIITDSWNTGIDSTQLSGRLSSLQWSSVIFYWACTDCVPSFSHDCILFINGDNRQSYTGTLWAVCDVYQRLRVTHGGLQCAHLSSIEYTVHCSTFREVRTVGECARSVCTAQSHE